MNGWDDEETRRNWYRSDDVRERRRDWLLMVIIGIVLVDAALLWWLWRAF